MRLCIEHTVLFFKHCRKRWGKLAARAPGKTFLNDGKLCRDEYSQCARRQESKVLLLADDINERLRIRLHMRCKERAKCLPGVPLAFCKAKIVFP